jgi:hypothetical protein
MSDGSVDLKTASEEARQAAYAVPIEALNPAQSKLFQDDAMWPYVGANYRGKSAPWCRRTTRASRWREGGNWGHPLESRDRNSGDG